jgi:hypothetical protein
VDSGETQGARETARERGGEKKMKYAEGNEWMDSKIILCNKRKIKELTASIWSSHIYGHIKSHFESSGEK